jgi:hypothetical protein
VCAVTGVVDCILSESHRGGFFDDLREFGWWQKKGLIEVKVAVMDASAEWLANKKTDSDRNVDLPCAVDCSVDRIAYLPEVRFGVEEEETEMKWPW